MKKLLTVLLALLMVLGLAACGSSSDETADDTTEDTYKVAYLVNGNLGDKSFFDSAEAGLETLVEEGKIELKTIEMGATDADKPKWEQTLSDCSDDGSYDLIIVGTYQMPDYLKTVAEAHPEQKYVIFDDNTYVGAENVINITYKQNEMGYCVGVMAAGISQTGIIGFVGGIDSPVINDFLVGYIEGAQSVNPDIKVDTRYVGNYSDTAKGLELSQEELANGVDVIWGCGGDPGTAAAQAVLEAREAGGTQWYIGVDSDQELTLTSEKAAITITSGLKNVGNSLIWVIEKIQAGEADDLWGTEVTLGLTDGGVGMVTDKNFATYVPADVQELVNTALEKVGSGEIVVSSALTDNAGAQAKRDAVQPNA